MAANVAQLAGWRIGPGLERFAYGLVAAAHGGDRQNGQYWVPQPPCAADPQLLASANEYPDHQAEQQWRPQPAEHLLHNRAGW